MVYCVMVSWLISKWTLDRAVVGVLGVGMCKRDDQPTDRPLLGILDASSALGVGGVGSG